jgi:colicin import membrane protein
VSTDSPILPRGNKPGKRISIALAIAVHLLLAGFLFYGVRWQTKATDVIEVELVRAMPEPAAVATPATPPPPVAVPPAPTVAPPPKPEPAPPPPKPDIVIKDKEKPKPPPKVEPPRPRIDPNQELLKRETEQLTQRKQAESAAQEFAQKQAAQAKAVRDKATASYVDSIVRSIRPKIVVPPDVKGHPEAVFDVIQVPDGSIVDVRLKRSSGHDALDKAIERAILKSSPLPKPPQADLFSRELRLRFRPLDD